MILGDHLAVLRRLKGWSQQEAAAKIGISKRGLIDLEKGNRNPLLSTLEAVATAYGVTLSAIFEPWAEGAETARLTTTHKKLSEIMAQRPDEGKAVQLMIEALYGRIKIKE